MAGLSKKETRALLDSMEAQGCTLVQTKAGVTVRFPNGGTMGVHWSDSDHRARNNLRADVKRAGLDWPFDGKDTKAMNADKRRKYDEAKELVKMWLAEHQVDPATDLINPAKLVEELGIGHSTIYRHLHTLGWVKKSYGSWEHIERAPEPVPEPAPSPLDTELERVLNPPIVQPPVEEQDWIVVKLTKGIADITTNALLNSYRAAGFQMEIRIKKDGAV